MTTLQLTLSSIVPSKKDFCSESDVDLIMQSMREQREETQAHMAGARGEDKDQLLFTYGLTQYLVVTWRDQAYHLVDGWKRYMALLAEGFEQCFFRQIQFASLDHERLFFLDSHVAREHYDMVQRGQYFREREEVLERLQKRAKRGYLSRDQRNSVGIQTTADLAKKAGVKPTYYRAAKRIAERITPDAYNLAREIGINDSEWLLTHVVSQGGESDESVQLQRLEEIRHFKQQKVSPIAAIREQKVQKERPPKKKADDSTRLSNVVPMQVKPVRVLRDSSWLVDGKYEFHCTSDPVRIFPSEGALGILPYEAIGNDSYDWLFDRCSVVAVLTDAAHIVPMARSIDIPYQGNVVTTGGPITFAALFTKGTPFKAPMNRQINGQPSGLVLRVISSLVRANETIMIPHLGGDYSWFSELMNIPADLRYHLHVAHPLAKELGAHLTKWKAARHRVQNQEEEAARAV